MPALPVPPPLPSVSVFDLSRDGRLPASGPSNPDPGAIEGEEGPDGMPRSGLPDGT